MMKTYLILGLLSTFTLSKAQGYPQDNIQIKSPQSNAFEKYGKIPVNLYTGAIDLKIPIVDIRTSNGKIDVLLSYDSSGFQPHKKSDLAGVNWSLIAGGKITRKINGIPDEYSGQPTSSGSSPFGSGLELHGFLTGVRLAPYTSGEVYDLYSGAGSASANNWKLGPNANGYEGEPDEFYFSMLELRGKFMIGNNGVPKVESNDPNITVDISGLPSYKALGQCRPPVSTIIIKDGKGNKYYFGGDMSRYEISYEKVASGMSTLGYSGFSSINTFNLAKVEFADGNIIEYKYAQSTFSETIFCKMHAGQASLLENAKLLSLENYLVDGSRADSWVNCPSNMWGSCTNMIGGTSTNHETYTLIKKSLLEEIQYNDYKIKINYTDVGYPIKHVSNANIYFNEYVIDNIELYNKDLLIQKNILTYEHYGIPQQRPFLKQIKELNSDKTYSFDYYKIANLPNYYTKGLDHWGYWNGNDSNISLAPLDTYNHVTGDYTLNNTFRDANTSKTDVALLSKIVFPTKGYTVFEYEPQSYDKRIERNSGSSFLPTLTNNAGIAGGARIYKKYDYTETGALQEETEYKYVNELNETTSSGILMNWPRYLYYFEFSSPGSLSKLMIKSSSNVQSNSLDNYNVGYSTVFEILKNKGYIKHEYTNYATNTDVIQPDAGNIRNYFNSNTVIQPENLYKNFKNLYGVDYSILRGLPKKISYFAYNNSSSPLKTEEFEYYNDLSEFNPNTTLDNNNYVSIQHLSGEWVQGYKKYFNSSNLKKKIVTDIFNNTPVTTTTEYYYDSNNHLNRTKENNISTDNIFISNTYKYAGDPSVNNGLMISRNMIGIPLETTVTQTVGGVTKTLGKTETVYPTSLPTPQAGNLVLPISVRSYDLQNNTPTTDVTYDKYDIKGNIQQYTTKDGISTTIIWGYNQTQPIAKITGAKLSDIQQSLIDGIVNASNTDALAAPGNDESAFLSLLDTFRKDPSMAGYQVTTYTYDPLIGVRSITPPSGIREVYLYDSANRLKEIRENNQTGNILKEFKYNYKN
ncbi:hypothetical protein [Chryseobacterium mucoviscidosis]|uniref:Sugar-binding protein n=1 Tax=Chryseobacterium mucoviscidosis TaxID=1945581 RepID=A0A202BWG5_9FLAO|nr:hypothetical protein [Chryseobacterium mucoviscidosis]OVE55839.1 hypothetical protein B0E34_16630 [Chryseobacterium mucoviscidosis]